MKTEPFSIRLESGQDDRIMQVIVATGGAYTKTDIIMRALNMYLSCINGCPDLLPGYDPQKIVSVTQRTESVTHSNTKQQTVAEMMGRAGV